MKRTLIILALSMTAATFAFAHGGGMGGGGMGGGGMMAGAGMMIVADDSSLLVTNMDMSGMMDGSNSSETFDRDLVNIDKDGSERWRVSFTDGWPMMPTTEGDLVVVVLVSDWFMGDDGTGDHGNPGGGRGGGMKAFGTKDVEFEDRVIVVGLDLATGAERWRTTFTADMGSMVQFTPDGTQIYLSLMDMDGDHGVGMGSMNQGQSSGVGMTASTTIVALNRSGVEQWRLDLSSSGGMGGGR
jgi:outer membrane protein assembly factor BamB